MKIENSWVFPIVSQRQYTFTIAFDCDSFPCLFVPKNAVWQIPEEAEEARAKFVEEFNAR